MNYLQGDWMLINEICQLILNSIRILAKEIKESSIIRESIPTISKHTVKTESQLSHLFLPNL